MTTGEKIRQQRRLLNMTQEELSRLVGVSLKTIQRWEAGERSPRLEEANKLSEALNVSAGYLMGEDDTAPAVIPVKETHAKSANMAVMTLENGCKVEAPATPEGYAFLKELFAMSIGEQIQAIANLAGKNPMPQTESWVSPLGQLGRPSPAVNQ